MGRLSLQNEFTFVNQGVASGAEAHKITLLMDTSFTLGVDMMDRHKTHSSTARCLTFMPIPFQHSLAYMRRDGFYCLRDLSISFLGRMSTVFFAFTTFP